MYVCVYSEEELVVYLLDEVKGLLIIVVVLVVVGLVWFWVNFMVFFRKVFLVFLGVNLGKCIFVVINKVCNIFLVIILMLI